MPADQPGKHRRPLPQLAALDDLIGRQILAAIGPYADDVRDTNCGRIAGHQANDPDTAPNFEVVGRRCHLGNCCFRDRPTVPVTESCRSSPSRGTHR